MLEKIINYWITHKVILILTISFISSIILMIAKFTKALDDILKLIDRFKKPSIEPYKFSKDDFEREANPRFGFSYIYPIIWDRVDPQNGDGNIFVNPKDSKVVFRIWGCYDINNYDLVTHVSENLRCANMKKGYRLIENVPSGKYLIGYERDSKEAQIKQQIEGIKIKYIYKDKKDQVMIIECITKNNDTFFHAQCEAPVKRIKQYEDIFLYLLSNLIVLISDKQDVCNKDNTTSSNFEERDYRTLENVLISIPASVIDCFFDNAFLDIIIFDIFYFWEQLKSQIESSNFTINDENLHDGVIKFYSSFSKVMDFGHCFQVISNGNFSRFMPPHDFYNYEVWEKEHNRYKESVNEMFLCYKRLIDYVKDKYKCIDLYKIDKNAMNNYKEFHNGIVKALGADNG